MTSRHNTIYDRCKYLRCNNGSHNGYKLFRFPHVVERQKPWIDHCGNISLRTWAASSIRCAGLCKEHFRDEDFVDETKKSLRRNRLPIHWREVRGLKRLQYKPSDSEKAATTPGTAKATSKMNRVVLSSLLPKNKKYVLLTQPSSAFKLLKKPTDEATDKSTDEAVPATKRLLLSNILSNDKQYILVKSSSLKSKSAIKVKDQSINQLTDETIKQLASKKINQLTDKTINQLTDKTINQLTDKTIDRPKGLLTVKSLDELTGKSIVLSKVSSTPEPAFTSTDKMTVQPIVTLKDKPIIMTTDPPIVKPTIKSVDGTMLTPTAKPTVQLVTKPTFILTNQPSVTPTNKLILNQTVNPIVQPAIKLRDKQEIEPKITKSAKNGGNISKIVYVRVPTEKVKTTAANVEKVDAAVSTDDLKFITSLQKSGSMPNEKSTQVNIVQPIESSIFVPGRKSLFQTLKTAKQSVCAFQAKIVTLKEKLKKLQTEIKLERKKNWRMKNRIEKLKARKFNLDSYLENNDVPHFARTMINLQLHRRKTSYTQDEKDLAKMIYYKSAPLYSQLRHAGLMLPGESTIRNEFANGI